MNRFFDVLLGFLLGIVSIVVWAALKGSSSVATPSFPILIGDDIESIDESALDLCAQCGKIYPEEDTNAQKSWIMLSTINGDLKMFCSHVCVEINLNM